MGRGVFEGYAHGVWAKGEEDEGRGGADCTLLSCFLSTYLRRLADHGWQYVTALSKRSLSYLCRPEATSVVFDRTGAFAFYWPNREKGADLGLGSRLGVTFLNYFPTIYSINDSEPLAICTGRNRPDGTPVGDGERTYINSCTMKVSFSVGGVGWHVAERVRSTDHSEDPASRSTSTSRLGLMISALMCGRYPIRRS